ncbi:hypothetical protein R3P38DRAFT_3567055 [Favolaschia claudopus]|uniref:Uncharacterized protein n=1 Tax=Favolaschia claudopus TaxID=2862362 RepID=A0AAW0AUN3_9AGAR
MRRGSVFSLLALKRSVLQLSIAHPAHRRRHNSGYHHACKAFVPHYPRHRHRHAWNPQLPPLAPTRRSVNNPPTLTLGDDAARGPSPVARIWVKVSHRTAYRRRCVSLLPFPLLPLRHLSRIPTAHPSLPPTHPTSPHIKRGAFRSKTPPPHAQLVSPPPPAFTDASPSDIQSTNLSLIPACNPLPALTPISIFPFTPALLAPNDSPPFRRRYFDHVDYVDSLRPLLPTPAPSRPTTPTSRHAKTRQRARKQININAPPNLALGKEIRGKNRGRRGRQRLIRRRAHVRALVVSIKHQNNLIYFSPAGTATMSGRLSGRPSVDDRTTGKQEPNMANIRPTFIEP